MLSDQARLLRELALQRLDQRLPAANASTGQEPVLTPSLLVPDEQDRPVPAQERGNPDARLGTHRQPDEPSPPTPRSLGGSSVTSTSSIGGSSTTTSWAIRIPGSTRKGSSRSVLWRITLISPR